MLDGNNNSGFGTNTGAPLNNNNTVNNNTANSAGTEYRYTRENIPHNQEMTGNTNGSAYTYGAGNYNSQSKSEYQNYNAAKQAGSYQNNTRQSGSYQQNAYTGSARQSGSYQQNAYTGSAQQSGSYQQNAYGSGAGLNNTNQGSTQHNSAGGSYHNSTSAYNGYNNQPFGMAQDDSKKHKKTKHKKDKTKPNAFVRFFKHKATKLVASALAFGLIAGSVMYGVYYAGGEIFPKSSNSSNHDITSVSSVLPANSDTDVDMSADSNGLNVQDIAKATLPAMVQLEGVTTVSASDYYGYGSGSRQAKTSGSGIIVGKNDTELLILTNAHVVDDVSDLKCVFVDNSSVDCAVKGSKSDKDIAVVAVKLSDIASSTQDKISIAELGDSDDVQVGQQVVAIGNALGEGQSVTTGIISATERTITVNNNTFSGLFLTDAAINSGNSGGALLNDDGKVIGINFAKSTEDTVEGMAYAIPVSNVKDIINSLMNIKTRDKVDQSQASYLGISGVDITSSMASAYGYPQGIMIRQVASDSPADDAGLETYDIIVSFDDKSVTSMSSMQSLLKYYAAGETVTIGYYHKDGSEYVLKSTKVTLGHKNS